MIICNRCGSEFTSKSSLQHHQSYAKYCRNKNEKINPSLSSSSDSNSLHHISTHVNQYQSFFVYMKQEEFQQFKLENQQQLFELQQKYNKIERNYMELQQQIHYLQKIITPNQIYFDQLKLGQLNF